MQDSLYSGGNVLITGGTSGLGLELVKLFLKNGFFVVATGRQRIDLSGYEGRFKFYRADFSNLKETSSVMKEICETSCFDFVIYNAGILSPREFKPTADGYEYTYQVNFLAHLLLNEIIVRKHDPARLLTIAAVTSPIYRIAGRDLKLIMDSSMYNPFKAYSDSKLFLVLLCRRFAAEYADSNISYLVFDPGVFGSRIYRMQSRFFGMLYNIATPFMRKPASVARALGEVLTDYDFVSGEIYNRRKQKGRLPEIEPSVTEEFWKAACQGILPYLD